MLTTVSEATIRSRFYQNLKHISHAMHVRSCHIDYDREMAIVAEIRTDQKKRLIGIGSSRHRHERRRFGGICHDRSR